MGWDYGIFVGSVLVLFFYQHIFLANRSRRIQQKAGCIPEKAYDFLMKQLPYLMAVVVVLTLTGGYFFMQNSENEAKAKVRAILQGLAPTFAYELQKMGHNRIGTGGPSDSPQYLLAIDHMVNWMRLNPQIESIYTFRKSPDGTIVFILGPETDYDRDGKIAGDKEERIPIGTPYTETIPELEGAFRGEYSFQEEPNADRWGVSISAFAPIYAEGSDKPEAVLGIDFAGEHWNKAIIAGRLQAMGILGGFMILINACYLIAYFSWLENLRTKAHETQLRLSKEAAEAASRAKGEFLANMSHEIRTPLNAVLGMGDLLMETPLTEQQRELLHICRHASNSLLTIINDVLDFSKIEAGKLRLDCADFDLLTVVEGTTDLMAWKAREKGLSVMTYMDSDLPKVLRGDPGRLRQILLNLIGNAVKFTEQGEIVIRVLKKAIADNTITVQFEVIDSGIGISETEKKQLFEPFTQADSSTTRKYEGTGLGLSISKRLVDLMGGEMEIESQLEIGSVFRFTARFFLPDNVAEATSPMLLPTNTLIIDKSEMGREILQRNLTDWGIKAKVASQVQDALEDLRLGLATDNPFELIILSSSAEDEVAALTAGLTADPGLKGMKRILLGINNSLDAKEAAAKAGFSAYLARPVRQDQLMGAIAPGEISANGREAAFHPVSPIVSDRGETAPCVLLVEDNLANQKLALLLLQKLGLNAEVANNGRQAVAAFQKDQNRYRLILMDCQMPDMDGYQAATAIRALENAEYNRIPIIAMTACTLEGDREKCLAAGMDDYIIKPIDFHRLREVLAFWLESRRGKGQ